MQPALVLTLLLTLLGFGCASYPPLPTAPRVDLERFMGDWYVQGHIPASAERTAYNGVASYALEGDRKVLTTYAFRKGGFDGEVKVMNPTGTVRDRESNAEWGMKFFWFFSAEYLVAHVDEAYSETIIARTRRDYVWIMTREPEISDERYAELAARVEALGYDTSKLRRLPQRWPDEGHPLPAAGDRSLAAATRR